MPVDSRVLVLCLPRCMHLAHTAARCAHPHAASALLCVHAVHAACACAVVRATQRQPMHAAAAAQPWRIRTCRASCRAYCSFASARLPGGSTSSHHDNPPQQQTHDRQLKPRALNRACSFAGFGHDRPTSCRPATASQPQQQLGTQPLRVSWRCCPARGRPSDWRQQRAEQQRPAVSSSVSGAQSP